MTAPAQDFTQNALREGVVELAYGEPDPALLPVDLVGEACAGALRSFGPGALGYGQACGPPALREELAARITRREGIDTTADDVIVTGGNSQALDQVATLFARPSDVVLTESPTYSLALGILRDHPLAVDGVAMDDGGLDLEALRAALRRRRSAGRRVAFLYTIPTYHNPTGSCLDAARRRDLVELATREDLLVVEDDVYRELAFDGAAPPSLWSLDPQAPVLRLGSFSKSLSPGLRVGWVNARPDLRARFAGAGLLESGGCVAQFAATVVAALLANGRVYDEHVTGLREAYAARRDALVSALREYLPAACDVVTPQGGFFVWLRLPAPVAATALLPVAEQRGVGFSPGRRFCGDATDDHARLAFSLYDEDHLREGARRLAEALRSFSPPR